ncbi:hypothetical protein R75471_00417 [Paraburkholderia domus]|nr:hypothetical protein R75471_00417 [Paraburkholderia domus]
MFACDYSKFAGHFGFFLPLAETVGLMSETTSTSMHEVISTILERRMCRQRATHTGPKIPA